MTSTDRKFLYFVGLSFLFRMVFAFNVGLIDDEAYHWSWSKDLMFSYYDHPGMTAWINWIFTKLFGDTIFAVRFSAFLCFAATFFITVKLTDELFGRSTAYVAGFMILWAPFWGFGGYVSSPEAPFMLCWMSAAYVFWQGVRDDDLRWSLPKTWLILGLIMGLGLNSKFIIALLAPGFLLYLLISPTRRKDLLTPWPWLGVLVATILCFPIFKWNIDFNWPGFRYQFHDRHQEGGFNPGKYLQFLIAQALFLTPVPYFLILSALVRSWLQRAKAQWRLLFCLSIPSIAIFYTQALFADHKPHWSGAAYFILMMGASAIYCQGWGFIKAKSAGIRWGTLGFFIPMTIVLYLPFTGFLPKLYRLVLPHQEWNFRWDLSNEFQGWPELGDHLKQRLNEIESSTGKRPLLAALRYETTAQLWWGYKERVYQLNDFRSHYSVNQTGRGDWEKIRGQDFLVIGTEKYPADVEEELVWDLCLPAEEFRHFRGAELSRVFYIHYCKNLKSVRNIF